jgi:hypothetical protein
MCNHPDSHSTIRYLELSSYASLLSCMLNRVSVAAEGIVVCSGIGCMVSFTNVSFVKCTLVVLGGAEANLQACDFAHELDSPQGLAALAHGEQTSLTMDGGSIVGGAVGVAVRGGASVKMSDVTISKVSVSGVESLGDRSYVAVTNSRFKDFSTCCSSATHTHALHAHGCSSMDLKDVSICGQAVDFGVLVHTLATVSMVDCTVSGTKKSAVEMGPGSTGQLQGCRLVRSKECGLHVSGRGSSSEAVGCMFSENGASGACASRDGNLQLQRCESRHNEGSAGYEVKAGASLKLIECKSFADVVGCRAAGSHAALTAHMGEISCSVKHLAVVAEGAGAELDACVFEKSGNEGVLIESPGSWACLEGCSVADARDSCVLVRKGAKAALKWCTLARSVEWNGLDSHDAGTEVHLEQCTLQGNNQNGACAGWSSTGKAVACRSVGNGGHGYGAWAQGHMTIVECSSDSNVGGGSGCGEDSVLVKDRLCVNGTLEK